MNDTLLEVEVTPKEIKQLETESVLEIGVSKKQPHKLVKAHTVYITPSIRVRSNVLSQEEYARLYRDAGYSPETIQNLLDGLAKSSLYESPAT